MDCPSCGTKDAYVGFTSIECTKTGCQHYSEGWAKERGVRPTLLVCGMCLPTGQYASLEHFPKMNAYKCTFHHVVQKKVVSLRADEIPQPGVSGGRPICPLCFGGLTTSTGWSVRTHHCGSCTYVIDDRLVTS